MNDPGLHEPAQQAAQDVENKVESDGDEAEREENEFLDPTRWWFASTACPLIAGTFGPMANAFSICALVESWRVYIPPGKDEGHGDKLEDPKWLIAINSISLVFALAANMSLLLNMARKVSFEIAQPITILGWYLASFLLMALVIVASTSIFRLQPMEVHALGQAYYYGIIAAGLYFIIATLMAYTAFGAWQGHYSKDFQLSPSQRTLMLQTIGFMVYLLLGALVFSKVEGWHFLDGVFWADFTLLTIGIGGEFVTKTHTGRSLLFPFAIGGLITVGLVIGSIRSLILEHGKQKMTARFTEVKRQEVLSTIDDEDRTIKLSRFEQVKFSQKGLSELQRREQEFTVMRRVHELSERKRRYTALAISSFAALALWFLGALVFWKAEKPQGYSYFVWLYFSYTSLLTIGYGDLVVMSNSGKAFFVFWSLLAVPTLTVLISNMGDTIIKGFKDFTIWVGSFTVLPDEHGFAAALKIGLRTIKPRPLLKRKNLDSQAADKTTKERGLDRLAKHIEKEELEGADEAEERGDYRERDIHFYHFVLAKEIRQLMNDMATSPTKQYSYEEWSYYLRLIGQHEDDSTGHRKPEETRDYDKADAPDIGSAGHGESIAWSWLGIRSPLMGNTHEPQWLLEHLSAKLESEMNNVYSTKTANKQEKPPISMSELRNRKKNGNKCKTSKDVEEAEKEVNDVKTKKSDV